MNDKIVQLLFEGITFVLGGVLGVAVMAIGFNPPTAFVVVVLTATFTSLVIWQLGGR